jgi:small GTP-binding protein
MEPIQVVLVGDAGTSKTSLIQKFKQDQTSPVGVQTELMIWDTAGQEKYRSLVPFSFHSANGVAIVFDLSRRSTFENLQEWGKLIEDSAPQNVVRLLVGNKSDLASAIAEPEIDAACLGMEALSVFSTSAMTGDGITELFQRTTQPDIPRDSTHLKGIREEDRRKVLKEPKGCDC